MRIGITSTIPSEIPVSAGHSLVDLNNVFVSSGNPKELILTAERSGFPASCCGWIRGIYGVVKHGADIDLMIAVSGGDCSNANALSEVLRLEGLQIVQFSYPHAPSRSAILAEMEALAATLGTDIRRAEDVRRDLVPLREALSALDAALSEGRISPSEYSRLALSSSDFAGNLQGYTAEVEAEVEAAGRRKPQRWGLPVALAGVPPIIPDLHSILAECGLQVVFNEIPRQFSMPFRASSLPEQYTQYTYPYGMTGRADDIREQCQARGARGVIHYTQSFCFRAIEDIVLRRMVGLPVLTIEGDGPDLADERLRIRLESFAELLRDRS